MRRRRKKRAGGKAPASFACRTKYPIVLVHGTGFRDRKLLNYWGRIPKALGDEGARVYYSHQDAWGTVAHNAEMVKRAVLTVLKETGAEKVNLIAHSKGGLDARYMIAALDMADKVASLTTVSTPHHGSKAIDVLWRAPKLLFHAIGVVVNLTYRAMGDEKPDFYRVTRGFRTCAARRFNERFPDSDKVYYQSYASTMLDSFSDFIFVLTHSVVKRFDGENDGLVSADSARWGRFRGELRGKGRRGISHGDVVDMRRMDIKDVNIRELYIGLVRELKDMGF